VDHYRHFAERGENVRGAIVSTVYDPSTAPARLALRLPQVDLAIGRLKPLTRAARCRLINLGKYPSPIFKVAAAQVVLADDVRSFLLAQREKAAEQAVSNAAIGQRLVEARRTRRSAAKSTAAPPMPGPAEIAPATPAQVSVS
jgi:hypothetical protein